MRENRFRDCDFIKETQSVFPDAGLDLSTSASIVGEIRTSTSAKLMYTRVSYYHDERRESATSLRAANDLHFVRTKITKVSSRDLKLFRIADIYIIHLELKKR